MIVNNSGYMPTLSQAKSTDSSANVAVVGGNNPPVEKNSSDSVQISEEARSKILQEIKSGGFVDFTGEDGLYKKGLMMGLGESTVQEWSAKGLNISDEAVIAAGKTFDDAFKRMTEENGTSLAGKGGLALNKHQIILNSQEVPDWFTQEYESVLSSMDNKEMKTAFEKGELFFISKPSSSRVDALASYASVEKYR
ncbi:MAG: hypothetical protein ACI8O8_003069 [Oleiphilaceae bacterium]|jgi:hypothetical protein